MFAVVTKLNACACEGLILLVTRVQFGINSPDRVIRLSRLHSADADSDRCQDIQHPRKHSCGFEHNVMEVCRGTVVRPHLIRGKGSHVGRDKVQRERTVDCK